MGGGDIAEAGMGFFEAMEVERVNRRDALFLESILDGIVLLKNGEVLVVGSVVKSLRSARDSV